MQVKLYIWENENSPSHRAPRTVPYGLAVAYGENAGYYKVQAVELSSGIVLQEWKQPCFI